MIDRDISGTIAERVRTIHSNTSGTMSLFALLESIFVACLIVLIVNTSVEASKKTELQTAVDASTLSGGAWMARGLNLISANNVTQTQLLGFSVVVLAFGQTVDVLIEIAKAQEIVATAATALPYVGAAAAFYVAALRAQIVVLGGESLILKPLVTAATPPSGLLWLAMQLLGRMSGATALIFPALAEARTVELARENGAKAALLVPWPTMPVHAAAFEVLCDPTDRGSPEPRERGYHPLLGYLVKEGPLRRYGGTARKWFNPFVNLGGPLVFDGLLDARFRQV